MSVLHRAIALVLMVALGACLPFATATAAPSDQATPAGSDEEWAEWHAEMMMRAFSRPAEEMLVSVSAYRMAKAKGDKAALRRAMVEIETIGAETPQAANAYTRQEFKAEIRSARDEGDQRSLFDLLTSDARSEDVVYSPTVPDVMLDEAERIAKELGSRHRQTQIHFERGWRHFYMDRKADATREFDIALRMMDKPIEKAQVLMSQLAVLQSTTSARSSIDAVLRQLEATVDVDDYPVIGLVVATELGESLDAAGNYAAAERQYRLALQRAKRAGGLHTAGATRGLAGILIDRGELKEAQQLLDSRDWTQSSDFMQFYVMVERVRLLAAQRDPRAVKLLPQAQRLLEAFSGGRAAQAKFHSAKAAAYSSLGMYRQAYEAERALRDDLEALGRSNNEALRLDLQTKYDVAAKESENALLKASTALLQQRRDALAASLMATVAFLAVVGSLLWLQVRQKRRLAKVTGDLAKANHDLYQLHASRTKLLAAACHDLRQPAHALGMLAELADGLDDPVQRRLKLEGIRRCSATLTDMLSTLMDLTQLEGGAYKPDIQAVPLCEMLTEVELQYAGMASQKGLELKLHETDVSVFSDRHLLRRILFNLVSNAIKYTRSGSVTVEIVAVAETVTLSVTDTGPGIDQEKLEQAFVDYVRLDSQYVPDGLGLGLPIVKRAAALLGHQVALQSRVGVGTVARLQMQAAPGSQAQTPALESTVAWSGRSVCLIEDDDEARTALAALLRHWGFVVTDAPDFQTLERTLAEARSSCPDLIISDMHLGHESGLEAISRLRCRPGCETVRALLLTGDLDHALAIAAKEEGVALAHKPLLPSRLRARLIELLESSPLIDDQADR